MFRSKRSAGFGLLILSFGCLTGCSGSNASATGTVTYDGTPVDDGSITFVPDKADGRKPVNAPIANGKYTVESGRGLAPGKYKVEITANKKADGKADGRGDGKKGADPDLQVQPKQVLPEKYNKQSTLTADIGSGSNTADFKLDK